MEFLSEVIKEYCQTPCYYPANFEYLTIETAKKEKETIELHDKSFDFLGFTRFFFKKTNKFLRKRLANRLFIME